MLCDNVFTIQAFYQALQISATWEIASEIYLEVIFMTVLCCNCS